MNAHFWIKKTAEAIQNGVKPYKLIENPEKILSGKIKKIVLNRTDHGLRLYKSDVEILQKNGLNTDNYEWKSLYNNKLQYIIFEERDNSILIDAVEAGILKDFVIFEVPVEDWAWNVKYIQKPSGAIEYIEMLI